MENDKPEGYPYTTVVATLDGRYTAQLIDWSPHGFPQISECGHEEESFVLAKRQAVDLAKLRSCHYKVPVHG